MSTTHEIITAAAELIVGGRPPGDFSVRISDNGRFQAADGYRLIVRLVHRGDDRRRRPDDVAEVRPAVFRAAMAAAMAAGAPA